MWHYHSGKLLSTIEEPGNDINFISYRKDGLKFVTCGSDKIVRVYDSLTLKLEVLLESGTENKTSGHSNRVFCAKFHPKDPNLLISGGWDDTLQIWDLRLKKSIRSIYGPHICGDAIDLDDEGNRILTGSYKSESPLQVWDWATGKLLSNISWNMNDTESMKACYVYSASFSKGRECSAGPCQNRFILAGGTNLNEVRMYTTESQRVRS